MDIDRGKPSAAAPEFALAEEELRRQLTADSNRATLEAYLGVEHYGELQKLAIQAARRHGQGTRARVYILPGIMGSRLGSADEVLWIDPGSIGRGGLTKLALPAASPAAMQVRALGPMVPMYLKLKLRLELAGFDARFHAYDWRQGLDTLGRELLEQLRRDPGEKILLLAHSMGGLVGRVAMTLEKQTGAAGKIARLVLIGTPHAGSFAPFLALRGVYPAVRKIATLDPKNTPEQLAARVFNTFPGLLHMLPDKGLFAGWDLYDPGNWPGKAPALGPRRELLQGVARVRDLLAPPDERFVCIAGVNQETVTGMERSGDAFDYLTTCEGDGTVPVSSAILPGMPAYYVDELHPALPNNDAVVAAAIELLEQDRTSCLPQTWQRRHAIARRIDEARLRQQEVEKKDWETLSMEERRKLLLGLALPV